MSITLKNHYTDIKSTINTVYDYPNKDKLNISLPARILILGPSGSMKSNLALEFIRLVGTFERVVLLAKNLEEPLYKHLAEVFGKVEKKHKKKIFFAIDSIPKLPPIDAFDPKENNLLIVDDMICENPKELAKIEEFWIRGRKNSVTMLFLSQDYISTPKKIRRNSNYIMIKRLNTVRDLKLILSDFKAINKTSEELMGMYERSVAGGMTDFFMVDLAALDPKLRFRHNFDPI